MRPQGAGDFGPCSVWVARKPVVWAGRRRCRLGSVDVGERSVGVWARTGLEREEVSEAPKGTSGARMGTVVGRGGVPGALQRATSYRDWGRSPVAGRGSEVTAW